MIIVHRANGETRPASEMRLERCTSGTLDDAVWIDLVNPTPEDDHLVEEHLGIAIPTREEMRDLEPSELNYTEGTTRYMTARVICHSDTEVPRVVDVTFILTEKALVTVRYDEPGAFTIFQNRATKAGGCGTQPEAVLDGLIETIVDRAAEVLRGTGDRVDTVSRKVFGHRHNVERGGAYQAIITRIGQFEHIVSNVRESMVSIERVLLFLSAIYQNRPQKSGAAFAAEWRSAVRDVQAIEEHATFLSNKLSFLLQATLGLVGIEQNKIIKLFSVVSVALMPPTLIASIYGMNFKTMPELNWEWGYPMAIGLMLIAALVPYWYFRRKGWL